MQPVYTGCGCAFYTLDAYRCIRIATLLRNPRTLTSYNIRKMILYGKAMNQKIENLLNVSLSAQEKSLRIQRALVQGLTGEMIHGR